jgi:excisionase family DNA binding protein
MEVRAMPDEMVDVHELARRYGPPTTWWYAGAERGEIPSYKLGKYRRFKISEIERWLEGQRRGPEVEVPAGR